MKDPDETPVDPDTEAEGYVNKEDIPENPDTRAEGKTDMQDMVDEPSHAYNYDDEVD